MHSVSQIIERNLPRREGCVSGLWINPEKDGLWQNVKSNCTALKLLSQDFGSFTYLKNTGAVVEFATFPASTDEKYNWVIVNLPRQKALLKMILDYASSLLAEDGVLWLAGENNAGIKSADKLLKQYFRQVRKLDNARHCSLYEAHGVTEQQTFDPTSYRLEWTLDCKPKQVKIVSYPGVFAHGRVDSGTALLLEALSGLELEGEVLDFACGAGVIGTYIAVNQPKNHVCFLDNSALALRACEETLAINHVDGNVLPSDGLSMLESSFDTIVSNPPIHANIKTDTQLGMRLLESVHQHLRPGGVFIMVANVHLPYEPWLKSRFSHSQVLAANKNFKVILTKNNASGTLSR